MTGNTTCTYALGTVYAAKHVVYERVLARIHAHILSVFKFLDQEWAKVGWQLRPTPFQANTSTHHCMLAAERDGVAQLVPKVLKIVPKSASQVCSITSSRYRADLFGVFETQNGAQSGQNVMAPALPPPLTPPVPGRSLPESFCHISFRPRHTLPLCIAGPSLLVFVSLLPSDLRQSRTCNKALVG